MKNVKKITIALVGIFILLNVIGLFIPSEKMVTGKIIVDKIYFFVMADISYHSGESSWRSDIDTVIQRGDMDGLTIWVEKYNNGDSALLKTIKIMEADFVREIIEPRGKDRLRIIQLKDMGGTKTAIKMSEETIIKNPITRIIYLFNNKSEVFVKQYLRDLKTKYENEPEDDNMAW